MKLFLRQFVFVFYSIILQWPMFLLFWVMGQFGLIKSLFLIYPTDIDECLDFAPDIPWLRRFYSGRPTPTGLIFDNIKPVGMYFLVPNTAMELVRKKNRYQVDNIMKRMLFFKKLTGAKTIGLAGQLGPIFEKHIGESLQHPFYSSTFGNIFSIQSAVNHVTKFSNLNPWNTKIAIIGGGELANQLKEQLEKDRYNTEIVNIKYGRKSSVTLVDKNRANDQLRSAQFAINLLPRGKDFLDCQIQHRLPDSCAIIDFSRPQLQSEDVPQKVFMGNRVQGKGLRFVVRLPGGWEKHEIPACSMPCLLMSLGSLEFSNIEEFKLAANRFQFFTGLKNNTTIANDEFISVGSKLPTIVN